MARLTIGDQFPAAAAGISGKDVIGSGIREKSPAETPTSQLLDPPDASQEPAGDAGAAR